jgi:hypothetical protein
MIKDEENQVRPDAEREPPPVRSESAGFDGGAKMELCAAEYWCEWRGHMLSCQLPKGHTHAHIDYGIQWANVTWIARSPEAL